MKKLFLYFIILIGLSEIYAQSGRFDSLVVSGINQIYGIHFDQATTTFRQLIADYPDQPAGRFFLAMIDWWKILLDIDNESNDELFFQKLEDVIYQCDQILEREPDNVDALFFKGGAIGFRGRLRATRESWLKAADDGREALPIVERASKLDPSNTDVQLGFGIYNYFASIIPDQYPLLKPLMIFFPSGDKQEGIEQLTNTANNGKYAKYEAIYFLMTLYYNYENNTLKAGQYADMLTNAFPDNPVFQRWKGRIEAKRGNMSAAKDVFIKVIEKGQAGKPGYNMDRTQREANYYVGVFYRNNNSMDSSKYYFNECTELCKKVDTDEESGFYINSVLYLGMINDQQGNREEAIRYYEQLLDMREYGRSHEFAEQYLEEPYK